MDYFRTTFVILFGSVAIFSFVYLLGHLVPEKKLLRNIPKLSQQFILGISIFIIVSRVSIRFDVSYEIIFTILVLMIMIGGIKFLFRFKKRMKLEIVKKDNLFLILFIFVILISPLFPIIKQEGLFYLHTGPDLTGHIIQTASLKDGLNFSKTETIFKDTQSGKNWWDLDTNPWQASDFKTAIAIEFTLRTQRYAHSIFTNFLSTAFGIEIWHAFITSVILMMMVLTVIIFDYLKKFKVDSFTIGASIIFLLFSHTFILTYHEGIIAQIYSYPFFIFGSLYINEVLRKKLNISGVLLAAIIMSAFINTMPEAVIIYAIYLILILILLIKEKSIFKVAILNLVRIAFVFGFISLIFLFDLIRMYLMRLQQGFNYTGFGDAPWNTLSILVSYPYLDVRANNSLDLRASENITSLVLLLFTSVALLYIYYRNVRVYQSINLIIAAIMTILIFKVIGNNYPIWKAAAIIQAIIILPTIVYFKSRITLYKFFKPLFLTYSLSLVFFSIKLLNQYSEVSLKIDGNNFKADFNIADEISDKFLLVTPTSRTEYSIQGIDGNLYYGNSGWGPIFQKSELALPIYFYYDCQFEEESTCIKLEQNGFSPERLFKLDYFVGQIVNRDGTVSKEKLNSLISNDLLN